MYFFWTPEFIEGYDKIMRKAQFEPSVAEPDEAFASSESNSNLEKIGRDLNARCVFIPYYKDWILQVLEQENT